MTTSCQSLGFNVPADKFTLDSVNEKVDIVVSAVNEFATFHYPVTTTGTGEAYLVTLDGTSELYDGMKLTIIPHTNATVSDATLNVNDLGALPIYRRKGDDTGAVLQNSDLWLKANVPVSLTYSVSLSAFLADVGGGSGSGSSSYTTLIPLDLVAATEENQTVFPINLETFDPETDSVMVKSGITVLHQNADYTVEGKTIVLTEGVPVGRTIGIDVIKNVITTEEENVPTVSGSVITDGSIDLSKLATPVATKSVVVETTLEAANWSEALYVWSNSGIVSANQVIEMSPGKTITLEQLEALQGANVIGTDQAVGSLTLKAFGDVPTVDIPVTFLLRGDV